ncbi:MAG: hypothetical protein LBO63_00785 [Oscillospiraceae bacterium]|nr:hypothetical protein [Oscillospiraceae bacterium]
MFGVMLAASVLLNVGAFSRAPEGAVFVIGANLAASHSCAPTRRAVTFLLRQESNQRSRF